MTKLLPILALTLLPVAAGCAAPSADERDESETGTSAAALSIPLPDYAVESYPGIGGCVLSTPSGNKWVYRFVLKNKGSSGGTIPMIKIEVAHPSPNVSQITKYLFNVPLAAGETKTMVVEIPTLYATTYTVTTSVDPAATILEWSKTNNVLAENEWWYNGVGLRYCD